jgi:hypothetical protein
MITVKPSTPYATFLRRMALEFNAVAQDIDERESMHALSLADMITATARRLNRGETIDQAQKAIESALDDIVATMEGRDIDAVADVQAIVDSVRPRCEVCDWPLAESANQGCVPGNCCYRPNGDTDEGRRIYKRAAEVAARRAEIAATEPLTVTSLDEEILRYRNAEYAESRGWVRPVAVEASRG